MQTEHKQELHILPNGETSIISRSTLQKPRYGHGVTTLKDRIQQKDKEEFKEFAKLIRQLETELEIDSRRLDSFYPAQSTLGL